MDARSNAAPVIIKRKKVVGGGGHHGGAWKVAYADFVTAMMAFFLLMWLMGATTEQQRKGIADYFSPSLPISRISGGGDGAFGGDSMFSEDVLPQNGIGASDIDTTEHRQARGKVSMTTDDTPAPLAPADADGFEAIENALRALRGESMVADEILRHIVTRVTDEGLVIEIFDLDGARLFTAGTAEATPLLQEIAALIASVSGLVENRMAVAGHTRARPITLARNPVWDLSTSRANQMRLLLETVGVTRSRMRRVTGHADRSPATQDPMALRNNRLEVILLRSDREVK
ncbi:chemotaxis protein MotB [Roseovarius azorensis]|uniref:Chemotaxis protein MotB n=1 Tax=Roseovarius azorensis TaxID=1287727 RepID=A0A1H7R5L4_9RHOB|nr:flagellar motor protein MotB [Roseovarius azorensis]SEL55204.1 chemotaxis protein MotB [Roseovarius azorensis]